MSRIQVFAAIFAVLSSFSLSAQIRPPVESGLRSDLLKVVAEFPVQFTGIRGDVVGRNPQTTEYHSKINVSGARECNIVEYSSGNKPVYSWHAVMHTGENFGPAARKYRWLYNQVKGNNSLQHDDPLNLTGKFEEPSESRGFAVTTLSLDKPPAAYQNLRIDVSLQFEFPVWKVELLVYEKAQETATDENDEEDTEET
jgi:hypothetical protein